MLFPSPGARDQPAESSGTRSPPALGYIDRAGPETGDTGGPAGLLQRRGAAFQLHSSWGHPPTPGGGRTLSSLQRHSVLGEEASGTCCLLLGFGDVLFVDLSS